MRKLTWWLLRVFCILMSTLLYGQGETGSSSVTGRVTDPSGVIAGAGVTLTDTSTGIDRTTPANSPVLYISTIVSSIAVSSPQE